MEETSDFRAKVVLCYCFPNVST